ncbi:MAG TPA: c-type cytochrome [Bryobacteraceae bacterium]|nr:c-type cytochrome [Bryobacteraceae bacterium]
MSRIIFGAAALALALSAQQAPPATGTQTQNQTPPAGGRGRGGAAPQGGGGGGGFANAFPQHEQADPAQIERGKALYGVHCTFCHGSDVRGGEGGPNLLRSQLVLSDKAGEAIAPVVLNGRPDAGMPKFNLTNEQISDIAAFIHSFRVAGYDASRERPISILVGDAQAGEAYFKTKCASCHSPTGDLKGFASKITEPRALQQAWMMPGGGGRGGRGGGGGSAVPPTTVTVTMPNGQKMEGRLLRIDDFLVTLSDANGIEHSIRRDGNVPKVEVHDPLEPHRELLRVYTDKNIHDLTAYLVTLK